MKEEKKKRKTHVPLRMNLLFFVVFAMFAVLILRLGVVQIVEGEDKRREVERTDDVTVKTTVPRGVIYDRNYNLVVDNEPLRAITYTLPKNYDAKNVLETAEKLAKIIKQDTDKITRRDKVDFWLMKNPKEAKKKLTEDEWKRYGDKEKAGEAYKLQVERVTDEELATLTDEDLEVLAIYREFTAGYALDPQIVKNKDVTLEEYAVISEHLDDLPGVDTMTDWERTYEYGDTLRSVLGNVSTGLPEDMLEYYQARDYSRNDRVGKSYLELQYEDVLRGQKEKTKNVTKSGEVIESEVLNEGTRGKDLVLTIDMELQQAVDKIIEEELVNAKRKSGTSLLDRAFVTLMNPNTGEILALSGKQYKYDNEEKKYKFQDFALGNFTTAYVPGSSVKGATVLTGYMAGVLNPGQTLLDEPLYVKGTDKKSSVFNRHGKVWLTDSMALIRSSNVYMMKTAIAVGGGQYRYKQTMGINQVETMNDLRYYFSQFGLGVKTGIDLPGEQIGFKGNIEKDVPGKVLDFSIGQYDSFTNLQLAQYVSTIANGGYRMKPYIVKEIREPGEDGEVGTIAQETKPTVLNRINASDAEVKHVQEAFWGVFHNARGTGYRHFNKQSYRAAGKTGTAQAFDQGQEVGNISLVAYAPYDNPEVAMAIIVPSAYTKGGSSPGTNFSIGTRVLKAYFDLKDNKPTDENEE